MVGRWLRILVLLILIVFPLALAVGSDQFSQTGQREQIEIAQEVTQDFTFIPFDPENTPEPTPFPSATPVIPPDVLLLLTARDDLELLADQLLTPTLGAGVRPEGWHGRVSPYDPQIALLTRLDLETLATTVINAQQRPCGGWYGCWFGTVGSTPYAVARDVRHDLELLAWTLMRNQRPIGWTGGDPVLKCDRASQTLVNVLERGGLYRVDVDANDPEFCKNVTLGVSRFVETEILANAQIDRIFSEEIPLLSRYEVTTNIAVAFLDSAATRRVGVIPRGTPILVRARSYRDFSKMVLVAGDGFEVYIEYTNTNLPDEIFRALPNAETFQNNTGCLDAAWCNRNN